MRCNTYLRCFSAEMCCECCFGYPLSAHTRSSPIGLRFKVSQALRCFPVVLCCVGCCLGCLRVPNDSPQGKMTAGTHSAEVCGATLLRHWGVLCSECCTGCLTVPTTLARRGHAWQYSRVKSVMPSCSGVRAGHPHVTLIPNTWPLRRMVVCRAFYFQGHFHLRRWGFTHRLVSGAELLLPLLLLRDGIGGAEAGR